MPQAAAFRRVWFTAILALVALVAHSAPASAQFYQWNGGGADGNWSTTANWTALFGPPPPPPTDTTNTIVILTGATNLTTNLDYNLGLNTLFFDTGAGAFTIGTTNSSTLTIGDGGLLVVNDNNQTINVNLVAAASSVWGNDGSATLTVNGNVDASLAPLTLAGAGNSVYNGIISGSGTSITKVDAGTVTLNGANTYTGVTAITDGVLSISADNNLGTAPGTPTAGSLLLNGGTLGITSTFTLDANRGIVVGTGAAGSAGTIDVALNQTLTYNGIITNNGANDQLLAKSGDGTLALGGVSTFSGGTLISAGTIRVDNASALGQRGDGFARADRRNVGEPAGQRRGLVRPAGDGGHPERHGNGDGHGGFIRGPERRGDVRRRSSTESAADDPGRGQR